MVFKIAFRSLLRHKRRSILTALAMIFGYVLLSMSICIADGMYANIIDVFTRNKVGHVQIHAGDYLDNPNIYKTIPEKNGITDILKRSECVKAFAPRIYSGGLAFFNTKSMGLAFTGIDPKLEVKATTIKERIVKGNFFTGKNKYEALVSETVSEVLKIGIGDKLVLISQGADGSIANDLFKVKGIVPKSDGHMVFLPIGSMQEFLALEGRVHEYTVVGTHQNKSKEIAKKLKKVIVDKNLDIQPWQVVEKDFYEAMMADLKGNYFFIIIIMVIVSLGVLNSILMNVLDRTKEFGVIKAIGTRPIVVFKLILAEMFLLSIISIFIGSIVATGVNYYWVSVGMEYPNPITYGGITMKTVKGMYSLGVYLEPTFIVLFSTLFVSLFPAIKAARVIPVKALRTM